MPVTSNPSITELLASESILSVLKAVLILAVGVGVVMIVRRALKRVLSRYLAAQQVMLIKRFVGYLIMGLFITLALNSLGLSLSVLLGAAGVITVALGFASQTSVSNIISGFFLIAEKPFAVDDQIEIEGTKGIVLSIDLLSVRLRTLDNLLVRIPNESMLKSKVINLSRFPIRRLDIEFGISYKEDINRVKELLFEVAEKNPLCLEEPRPVFVFVGYGEYSLNIRFCVWMKSERFLELRNSIYEEIKEAFDKNHIEIPYPHRTLYTANITKPLPIIMHQAGEVKTPN